MAAKHFAIVGCGTGGLATALFLAREGHRVTVFERFSEPSAVGAGILLQPTGMAVLRELGLLEALEATAARVDTLDGRIADGRRVMDVHYRHLAADAYALGVHRANLLQVLSSAAFGAGVELRCGAEVDSIQQAAGHGSLTLAGGEKAGDFDGIVIANGTQSRLRTQLGIPQTYKPYPWGALWTICPAPEGPLAPALQQRYDGSTVMIGVMPTGRDPVSGQACVSFFWSLKTAEYPVWRKTSFDRWKTQVLSHWPQIEPLMSSIADPEQLLLATYADVRMRHWHEGNTVVIGDAAHGMSPQLGQGANLALVDALVLGDCLASHSDVAAAFAAYSHQRRRHLRFYQFASRWLTPLFQSDSRLAAWTRDCSFPLTNRIPFTRREAIRTVAGLKTGLLLDRPALEVDGRSGLWPAKE
ncbi:MAG: FAD-dependent monooxygenase [Ectothiorhodospiraceae bacterium]|nr:FAD-dependent monooxygenase [Ectothiorhodospiraceae bacterium]